MNKKIITSLILCATLLVPSMIDARSRSHSSFKSSSSVKISKPITVKSKAKSDSTNKSTLKNDTTNKASSKESSKLDFKKDSKSDVKTKNDSFSIKVNKMKSQIAYKPKYYKSYNRNLLYNFSVNRSLLTYYMLDEVFDDDDDITEQDLVRELEKKGYTKTEIDKILKEGKSEAKSSNIIQLVVACLFGILAIGIILILILKKRRKK
ncbi:hypothetical protein QOZ83_00080 [Romboutsia sedimentorum]|uniref:hypothetical protein n=1 Tax=Romboutsia sedimentorum TaxID=1368474 RepID=UPI0024DE53BD|nr:hypothetical protein [Romboutsia sedimentorum]MDK2584241.1 hypothetical protein [Romboutsia sedimentorum]